MTNPPPPTPQTEPIRISIPASLNTYAMPASTYLTRNPTVASRADVVAVGALIFSRLKLSSPATPSKILLIQRSLLEGRTAGQWEVPGGGCEDSDPTILHSVAREVFEETGLHLTRVVRKVGPSTFFESSKGLRVVKLSFEIEVAELGGREEGEENQVEVELSPDEHQAYAWVREVDVEGYKIPSEEQREIIAQGFKSD